MRFNLKQARREAGIKQKEMAKTIGISERYYRKIEAGTNEGKGQIWDQLEALFEFKIPQRELRRQNPSPPVATEGKAH